MQTTTVTADGFTHSTTIYAVKNNTLFDKSLKKKKFYLLSRSAE